MKQKIYFSFSFFLSLQTCQIHEWYFAFFIVKEIREKREFIHNKLMRNDDHVRIQWWFMNLFNFIQFVVKQMLENKDVPEFWKWKLLKTWLAKCGIVVDTFGWICYGYCFSVSENILGSIFGGTLCTGPHERITTFSFFYVSVILWEYFD